MNKVSIVDESVSVNDEYASFTISPENMRSFALGVIDLHAGVSEFITLRNASSAIRLYCGDGGFGKEKNEVKLFLNENYLKDILYVAGSVSLGRKVNSTHRDYDFYNRRAKPEVYGLLLKIPTQYVEFDEADYPNEMDAFSRKWDMSK